MNRDLFLAILSMDSYNRGYGQGISGLNPSGSIGDAVIVNDSLALGGTPNDRLDARAGFYAIAYDMTGVAGFADGEQVISYRGTNFDPGELSLSDPIASVLNFFNSPLWDDIRTGWAVGAGWPGGQAALALEFYNAVAPDTVDPRYANITTTGHSLGGGLAGLVGNVYNRGAVLFDHMPYSPVSNALRAYASLSADARQKYFGGEEVWAFDESRISALSTEGEILSYLRLERSTAALSSVFEFLGFDPIPGASTPVVSHSDISNPVTLHSMALLVDLLWAQDNESKIGTTWQAAGKELWNGYFDPAVADGLPGIEPRVGVGSTASAAMTQMIAYSALDKFRGHNTN